MTSPIAWDSCTPTPPHTPLPEMPPPPTTLLGGEAKAFGVRRKQRLQATISQHPPVPYLIKNYYPTGSSKIKTHKNVLAAILDSFPDTLDDLETLLKIIREGGYQEPLYHNKLHLFTLSPKPDLNNQQFNRLDSIFRSTPCKKWKFTFIRDAVNPRNISCSEKVGAILTLVPIVDIEKKPAFIDPELFAIHCNLNILKITHRIFGKS